MSEDRRRKDASSLHSRLVDALRGSSPARREAYEARRHDTLTGLNQIDPQTLVGLSALTLPEVEALKEEVASILPAGNLPGLILSGLTTLQGRRISRIRAQDDINALFQGASLLPQGVYSILIAGPAAVLSAYQGILTLAGKDIDSAFPEGTWQFYLGFGLREDTGRHTNETISYHRDRPSHARMADDMAAWLLTAIHTLFDTEALNGAMWTEWTTLRLLRQAAQEAGLAGQPPYLDLLRNWQHARPYRTPLRGSYADQRRAAFDEFVKLYLELLPAKTVRALREQLHELSEQERVAYQQQMSLLARLEAGRFRDERVPVPLWEACVGLIWQGQVFLFDVCAHDEHGHVLAFTEDGHSWVLQFGDDGQPVDLRGRSLVARGGWLYTEGRRARNQPVAYMAPPDLALVKGSIKTLLLSDFSPAHSNLGVDRLLVRAPRGEQRRLRAMLPEVTRSTLEHLSRALILINWDEHDSIDTLGSLRRKSQRGIGDHALTVIRTTDSIVFDQSHVFFDGLWGMAMAEVMTNQAVTLCELIVDTPAQGGLPAPLPLTLESTSAFEQAARAARLAVGSFEVDAEVTTADMPTAHQARTWLKQRGVPLTINDLLLLARVLHAADYTPSDEVVAKLQHLDDETRAAVERSLEVSGGINPSLLIPMDASLISPRQRIYPTTFRNAILDLLDAYDDTLVAFDAFQADPHGDGSWLAFDRQRRIFFSYLRAFGEVLDTTKAIAMRGESFSTATTRLLAHLPPSMQHVLDQIPQRVGFLNEVVKGEEVFSNVGRVAPRSSLARFMSAKDDGRAKTLVWGVLTDDGDHMIISLRDFRPHVGVLLQSGMARLAELLAEDYLESYVATFNRLITILAVMALAEDELRWGGEE